MNVKGSRNWLFFLYDKQFALTQWQVVFLKHFPTLTIYIYGIGLLLKVIVAFKFDQHGCEKNFPP